MDDPDPTADIVDKKDGENGDEEDDEESSSSFPQNQTAGIYDDDDDEALYADEECGEGEDPFPARLEPSEAAANRQLFRNICFGLERIWLDQGGGDTRSGNNHNQQKKKKKPPPTRLTDPQKLNLLVPINMLKAFDRAARQQQPGTRPESLFPIYRLLLPHMDSRRIHMGESKLADIYTTAFHWPSHTNKYRMLHAYADPQFVSKEQGQGDLSSVIKWVVQDHQAIPDQDLGKVGSDWTIGQINEKLEEFAYLPVTVKQQKDAMEKRHNHLAAAASSLPPNHKKSRGKVITLKNAQADWLRSLHNPGSDGRKGLSPIEHKWLARILMKRMQFGLGWEKLLGWLHPRAPMAYTAKNNLRSVCHDFCDPAIRQQMDGGGDASTSTSASLSSSWLASYLPKAPAGPTFWSIFTPMFSERTGFDRVLDDMSKRHRSYLQDNETGKKRFPTKDQQPLALLHPAFVIEPKMDGERMLVHVRRDGVIRMHTRRGNWYSDFYSPALGPPLRRAIPNNVDVILDGEVIAWDSDRQETVPFGNNRTIALMRRQNLASRGLLDVRDKNIHQDESEGPTMKPSYHDNKKSKGAKMDDDDDIDRAVAGSECWLQFVAFDIVYLAGDGVADLLQETVSPHVTETCRPGSLNDLELFERKKLLYKLLTPQKDEVEIIQAWVIRPNGGAAVLAADYFASSKEKALMECGHPVIGLDSPRNVLSGAIANLPTVDHERRHGRPDDQISQDRARSIQHLYNDMVEQQRLEGLLFKDLSTPYFLGDESRSHRFWLKFKPDYYNGSVASDLDLAVVGGYFANGLSHGAGARTGKPAAVLMACVDSMDPERFFTICKVSVASMDKESRIAFFKATGFSSSEESDDGPSSEPGKWFQLDKKAKEIPHFISNRSFQADQDGQGWRVPNKECTCLLIFSVSLEQLIITCRYGQDPDRWIHPDDCPVLVLNAGEVVESEVFSAGLSLRFPRVTRVRRGADRKSASEVETEHRIWKIYQELISSRSSSNALTSSSQPMMGSPPTESGTDISRGVGLACRFLTERQLAEKKRTSKRRRVGSKVKLSVAMPDLKLKGTSSSCLAGLKVAVLGNRFHFDEKSDEYELAQEQGWSEEARKVRSSQDMMSFIVKHGGICSVNPDPECVFVVGNREDDPKVETHIRAIQNARADLNPRARTKTAERNAKRAESPGVVRWTFLFSLVYRCLKEFDGQRPPDDSAILKASVLDYLARPEGLDADSTLYEIEITSTYQMQRALDLIGKSMVGGGSEKKRPASSATTWWEETIQLPPEGRWVASAGYEPFWPFQKDQPIKAPVVVYPDIFGPASGCGFLSKDEAILALEEDRWSVRLLPEVSAITSLLPLVRIMGAMVTYHFHAGVTHVLTSKLWNEEESMTASEFVAKSASSSSSSSSSTTSLLAERLSQIQKERASTTSTGAAPVASDTSSILFVSPRWICRLWDDHEQSSTAAG